MCSNKQLLCVALDHKGVARSMTSAHTAAHYVRGLFAGRRWDECMNALGLTGWFAICYRVQL